MVVREETMDTTNTPEQLVAAMALDLDGLRIEYARLYTAYVRLEEWQDGVIHMWAENEQAYQELKDRQQARKEAKAAAKKI